MAGFGWGLAGWACSAGKAVLESRFKKFLSSGEDEILMTTRRDGRTTIHTCMHDGGRDKVLVTIEALGGASACF